METKTTTLEKKLPKGFKIKTSLNKKYEDQPLFKDKIERANFILKTVVLPKFQ